MGFAPPKDQSYGFQDYGRWSLWLPNMLSNGDLQLQVQNLRKRPNSMIAAALLVREKIQKETTFVENFFQTKTSSMVNMKNLKKRQISDEEDLHLGTSFSVETNQRDEDADKMKYTETNQKKRNTMIRKSSQRMAV
ncbi:hypothetical protein SUZIE_148415 [Sciurus carolinensis]|uniref:Uncharacterized protein n=1 Tax=Sciurus carolinensis TaxID=30640 RepID=A0AA41SVR2_SCICA|nr:hypothetical protein [Sciurus carolinensis]